MLSIYLQGLMLSAAMILPLGPQNMLVMTQGMRRQYHLMIASLCAISDALLISGGIFGGSLLLSRSPLLLLLITWGGVGFLLWYGWGALRSMQNPAEQQQQCATVARRWPLILTMLAVTWLNPHVYLDTVVILGSVGGQLAEVERAWFAGGAISASIGWFFALALLAAWLSPWLNTPWVQRGIHLLVALVMWAVAIQLARQGIAILMN